ncbi:hypothetical protein G6O69_00320 [Pseudenhygromyxa sp. WMMC2535]|uniref:hypothetical protein n=1 Tax=Pseudenhygromyxa sp. WMMC2535 TaxID=2712867 RepID=UPI001555BCA8|nr:hypothetical protein [Pseudenhygromyxa sp. WMMC2535]NVB36254.1 hypothetical protein [Pseudenhygromyxa sp. WMMC2535]
MSEKTIGEVWRELAGPQPFCTQPAWPPDIFALTSVLLADSGAYRLAISPHSTATEHQWPPLPDELPSDYDDVPLPRRGSGSGSFETLTALRRRHWALHLERGARRWRDWAEHQVTGGPPPAGQPTEARAPGREPSLPTGPGSDIEALCELLAASFDRTVIELAEPASWPLCRALLELHALADLASAGFGVPGSCELPGVGMRARQALLYRGSVATLPPDRVRVLPKLRTPQTGLTIRSLSHNLAIDRSEVRVKWRTSTMLQPGARAHELNLLILPWPYEVDEDDFRELHVGDAAIDPQTFGFFAYEPRQRFDPRAHLVPLLDVAEREHGNVSAVIMPESALSERELESVERRLGDRVGFLLAGVRGMRRNYAYLGVRHPSHLARYYQDKHHRWRIDAAQIEQYKLQESLDPKRLWWEPMQVRPRELHFVCANPWLCMAPLICEDLARPDPVADLIRAVGPNLVVALLMDGPQLSARWPGRYASALADDPGSSILTVTSLGMATRSVPPGMTARRTVALWKDPVEGAHEIELDPSADAVMLNVAAEFVEEFTADGRSDGGAAVRLVLNAVHQLQAPRAPARGPISTRARTLPDGGLGG